MFGFYLVDTKEIPELHNLHVTKPGKYVKGITLRRDCLLATPYLLHSYLKVAI